MNLQEGEGGGGRRYTPDVRPIRELLRSNKHDGHPDCPDDIILVMRRGIGTERRGAHAEDSSQLSFPQQPTCTPI